MVKSKDKASTSSAQTEWVGRSSPKFVIARKGARLSNADQHDFARGDGEGGGVRKLGGRNLVSEWNIANHDLSASIFYTKRL
jgi:hypothetical protein